MSFVRLTLALIIGIAMSGAATAQNFESPGVILENQVETGGLRYIQSAMDSFSHKEASGKQTGGHHVETNLAEHPVHAMRRRKATSKKRQKAVDSARPKSLIATAKEFGLHGQWFVLSGKKDGQFSEAQIGQQPGDVISLLPEEDAPGLLSMG